MTRVRVYGGYLREHSCDCPFCEGGFVGAYVDVIVEAASGERAVKLVEESLEGFAAWLSGQPVVIYPWIGAC